MIYPVGTKVEIVELEDSDPDCLKIGMVGEVLDESDVPFIEFFIDPNDELNDCCGMLDSKRGYALLDTQIKSI